MLPIHVLLTPFPACAVYPVQAKHSSIDFDYIKYAKMRHDECRRRMDECLTMAERYRGKMSCHESTTKGNPDRSASAGSRTHHCPGEGTGWPSVPPGASA